MNERQSAPASAGQLSIVDDPTWKFEGDPACFHCVLENLVRRETAARQAKGERTCVGSVVTGASSLIGDIIAGGHSEGRPFYPPGEARLIAVEHCLAEVIERSGFKGRLRCDRVQ